jgi:hypothetical protein
MPSFLSPQEPAQPARRRFSYLLGLGLFLNALALGFNYYLYAKSCPPHWQLVLRLQLVGCLFVFQVGLPLQRLLSGQPQAALRVWLLVLALTGLVALGFASL